MPTLFKILVLLFPQKNNVLSSPNVINECYFRQPFSQKFLKNLGIIGDDN